jgi:putative colanic acid biosynthesis UDP-glucose lipid carrier transferase
MNRQFERYLQMTLIILDLFVLNILYFLCELILKVGIPSDISYAYLQYLILSNIIWILLSYFLRTYADKVILNFEYFTKRTIQVYLLWIIVILFYLFFLREFRISRVFIISTIISFGLGLFLNRFLYLGIKNYFKNSHHLTKKVII